MPEATKCCSKCGQTKPRTEFSPHKLAKDGLNSRCRACRKEDLRERYRRNPDQARLRVREYRSQNLERNRESNRAGYHGCIALSRLKVRAYAAVRRALARGDLVKPHRCEACGKLEFEVVGGFEAHHYLGYAPEHHLDIQWLCVPCHREVESLLREVA